MQESKSLKYEHASEPLHISVQDPSTAHTLLYSARDSLETLEMVLRLVRDERDAHDGVSVHHSVTQVVAGVRKSKLTFE